jgi:hypothetical protein
MAAWNRFWYALGSTKTLGLFRIIFAGTLVAKMVGTWGIYKGLKAFRLRLPNYEVWSWGEFSDPVPGFEWLPHVSRGGYETGQELMLVAAVLLMVGLGTRVASITAAVLGLWFLLGSQFNYLHHVNVYVWVLVVLAFSPCGDHYSVDALIRRGWARFKGLQSIPPVRSIMSTRVIQIFLCIVYASTAWAKLDPAWYDGSLMYSLAAEGWLKGPWKSFILELSSPLLLSRFTVIVEGLLVFGLWIPRMRRFTAACGISFHLGIDAMMNVTTFSYMMISMYMLWMNRDTRIHTVTWDPGHLGSRLFGRAGRWFDWFLRMRWRAGETGQPLRFMRMDGRVFEGFHAIREVLCLLPLTFFPSFPLDWGSWVVAKVRRR